MRLKEPSTLEMQSARSPAKELSGFIHERVRKRTGVGIERRRFEPKSPPRIAPPGNHREDFAQDFFRLDCLEAKARCGGQRARNARFFLIFGNGSLVHSD